MEETGKPMRGRFGKKAAKKAPAKKTVAKKAPAKKVAKKKTSTKKTAAKKATKTTVAKRTITADDGAHFCPKTMTVRRHLGTLDYLQPQRTQTPWCPTTQQ